MKKCKLSCHGQHIGHGDHCEFNPITQEPMEWEKELNKQINYVKFCVTVNCPECKERFVKLRSKWLQQERDRGYHEGFKRAGEIMEL